MQSDFFCVSVGMIMFSLIKLIVRLIKKSHPKILDNQICSKIRMSARKPREILKFNIKLNVVFYIILGTIPFGNVVVQIATLFSPIVPISI